MKRTFFILILAFLYADLFSQSRNVARGAVPGELYLTSVWYGIYYNTLQGAVYHITENGKKLTIQYDVDYFGNPEQIMMPQYILADATPGVVYNKQTYFKNSYTYTALWVSFDYGKNWVFREENIGTKGYFSYNVEGLIYRGGGRGI